jgi:DNA invertase Pin-like site-specific DNA recombinase
MKPKRGEEHHKAILTEEKVRRIKKLIRNGVEKSKVIKHFGISSPHLSGILREKVWKYLS